VSTRKKRPVLYEVARPEFQRSNPACPPTEPRPADREDSAPASAAPRTPTPAPSVHKPAGTRIRESKPYDPRSISISASTLTLTIAGMIMLLFISFVSGRRYEAAYPSAPPAEFSLDLDSRPDKAAYEDPPPIVTRVDDRSSRLSLASDVESPPVESTGGETADQAARTVTLQKGLHYIVVQHFRKSRRADADAAAKFLLANDVPCALQPGTDIRLIATEPFLVDQPDAAAARRERTRADRLLSRIKELGKQFNQDMQREGRGGYTFSGCKLWEFK